MTKKASNSTKRISNRAFKTEFTEIISAYISVLPPQEQDVRIQAATRVVLKTCDAPRIVLQPRAPRQPA